MAPHDAFCPWATWVAVGIYLRKQVTHLNRNYEQEILPVLSLEKKILHSLLEQLYPKETEQRFSNIVALLIAKMNSKTNFLHSMCH
jgi:hypothetical protein